MLGVIPGFVVLALGVMLFVNGLRLNRRMEAA